MGEGRGQAHSEVPLLDDDHRTRVEKLRSLLAVAESQPPTAQTAHDLEAIRQTLRRAEAELNGDIEKTERRPLAEALAALVRRGGVGGSP